MIRKFVLATAAIATLATASLTATPASAHHFGGGFHHGWSHGYGFRAYAGGYDSCLRNRWVVNRYGNLVLRTVNVCY